jgi:hypothetical protein
VADEAKATEVKRIDPIEEAPLTGLHPSIRPPLQSADTLSSPSAILPGAVTEIRETAELAGAAIVGIKLSRIGETPKFRFQNGRDCLHVGRRLLGRNWDARWRPP